MKPSGRHMAVDLPTEDLRLARVPGGGTGVFVTWDKDDASASNHIATIVASPTTRPGTVSSTSFTHYSMPPAVAAPYVPWLEIRPPIRRPCNGRTRRPPAV